MKALLITITILSLIDVLIGGTTTPPHAAAAIEQCTSDNGYSFRIRPGCDLVFASGDVETDSYRIKVLPQSATGTLGGRLCISTDYDSDCEFQVTRNAVEMRTEQVLINNQGHAVTVELNSGNTPPPPESGIAYTAPVTLRQSIKYVDAAGNKIEQRWDIAPVPQVGGTLEDTHTCLKTDYFEGGVLVQRTYQPINCVFNVQ